MENKNCDHIYNWKHLFHRIGKVVKKAVQSGNRINMLRILKLKARRESAFGLCLIRYLPWDVALVPSRNCAVTGGGKSGAESKKLEGCREGLRAYLWASLNLWVWLNFREPQQGVQTKAGYWVEICITPCTSFSFVAPVFLCKLSKLMVKIKGISEGKEVKMDNMGVWKGNRWFPDQAGGLGWPPGLPPAGMCLCSAVQQG